MASTGSSTSGTTTTGSEIISSVNKQSGSGIDLKSLVTGLVNAETSVAQSQITKKVENTNLNNVSFSTLSSTKSPRTVLQPKERTSCNVQYFSDLCNVSLSLSIKGCVVELLYTTEFTNLSTFNAMLHLIGNKVISAVKILFIRI